MSLQLIVLISVIISSVCSYEDIRISYKNGSTEIISQNNICKYSIHKSNCTVPLNTRHYLAIEASACACYVKPGKNDVLIGFNDIAYLTTCYVPLPAYSYNVTRLLECHLSNITFETVEVTLVYRSGPSQKEGLFPFWIPTLVLVLILIPLLVFICKYRNKIKKKLIKMFHTQNVDPNQCYQDYTSFHQCKDDNERLAILSITFKSFFTNENVEIGSLSNKKEVSEKLKNKSTEGGGSSKKSDRSVKHKLRTRLLKNQKETVNKDVYETTKGEQNHAHGDDDHDATSSDPVYVNTSDYNYRERHAHYNDDLDDSSSDPIYVNSPHYNNAEETQGIYDLPKSMTR